MKRTELFPLGLVAALAITSTGLHAQFDEGDNVLGAGIGLLGGYNVGWTGSGVSESPALAVHFDHGMGDLGSGVWGLGGYVGYKTITYKEAYFNYYNYDYSYNYLVIGARGTWHYNDWHGEKWDTYGGLMLAYRSVTFTDHTNYGAYSGLNTYTYSGSGIGLSAFVGARYYFSDKVGAFGELGYGIAALQVGVAFKL